MSKQTSCLKCGAPGVKMKTQTIDSMTGRAVGLWSHLVFGLVMLLFASGWLLAMLMMRWQGGLLWFSLLIFVLPAGILGLQNMVWFFRAHRIKCFRYNCTECGHWWEKTDLGWSGVRCSACGNQKVTSYAFIIDPNTEKERSWKNLLYGAAMTVGGVITFSASVLSSGQGGSISLPTIIGVVGAVGGGVFIYRHFKGKYVRLKKHRCAVCTRVWTTRQPL